MLCGFGLLFAGSCLSACGYVRWGVGFVAAWVVSIVIFAAGFSLMVYVVVWVLFGLVVWCVLRFGLLIDGCDYVYVNSVVLVL